MAGSAREQRIRIMVEPNRKIAGKALAVFDQAREPINFEDKLKLLRRTMDSHMQRCRTSRIANQPALPPDYAFVLSKWQLDGNAALVELVEAEAWHER
jgi:hypothetical protein